MKNRIIHYPKAGKIISVIATALVSLLFATFLATTKITPVYAVFVIVAFVFSSLFIIAIPCIHWDQQRFKKQFNPNEKVKVTHGGNRDVITNKLVIRELHPYPMSNRAWYQRVLRIPRLIDHHNNATWLTFGEVVGGNSILQANATAYEMCIIAEVPIEHLIFPSGAFQRFLGTAHMVTEKTVKLTGNEDVYCYHDGWIKYQQ